MHANKISIRKLCSVVKLGILFCRVYLEYDIHKGLETANLDTSVARFPLAPAAPKLLEIRTQITRESHVKNKVYSRVVNVHSHSHSAHNNSGVQLGNVDHCTEDTDNP